MLKKLPLAFLVVKKCNAEMPNIDSKYRKMQQKCKKNASGDLNCQKMFLAFLLVKKCNAEMTEINPKSGKMPKNAKQIAKKMLLVVLHCALARDCIAIPLSELLQPHEASFCNITSIEVWH